MSKPAPYIPASVRDSLESILGYNWDDECEDAAEQLAEEGELGAGIDVVLVLRQQYGGEAEDDPGDAGEGEPDAEEARQESRPVDQQRERKKPQTPKQFSDDKSLVMQVQEEQGKSFALRLVEDGEKIGSADEDESSDGIDFVEKYDRDRDDDQGDHERSVAPVDSFEQVVQCEGHEDETGHADELSGDAEAEERFVGGDVSGGGRRVAVDEEFAGNIAHGEEADE